MTVPVGEPRVVVALDFDQPQEALALADRLSAEDCRIKVGKELFGRGGPELVRRMVDMGHDVFLDLKYHDIPNTVAGACRAAADLGVWMLNVHALGGREMMEKARDAVLGASRPPLLIAVTVLTSHDAGTLREIGCEADVERQVLRLARLAVDAGLDGVVCSAREAPGLRRSLGNAPILVTPGIRPTGSEQDDQRRVLTPAEALRAGSDYLVVGRPITRASDPVAVLHAINREIDQAFDTGVQGE
ncbi:MAG: orotidine-5'-phosphate decarboxylase [Aquisalimonadaceae bacterium]